MSIQEKGSAFFLSHPGAKLNRCKHPNRSWRSRQLEWLLAKSVIAYHNRYCIKYSLNTCEGGAKGMRASGAVQTCALSAGQSDGFLEVAHEVADVAAEITRKYFRKSFDVDVKADMSPVTIADREAECAMRQVLASRVPEHSIFGEEEGFTPGSKGIGSDDGSSFLWVLDPIDGTKSFITGKPVFGTLIALLHNGKPIIGILDQPIQKERWVGADGQPTTLNGKGISTRRCSQLSSAYMYATTPHMFEGWTETAFNRLRDKVRIPLYGCDCYAYGLLAAGHCDIVAEADLKPYDYMALVPIVKGSGGYITDWKGNELLWTSKDAEIGSAPPGEVLATGDKACHDLALKILQSEES
eukprot:jgi/Picsp_1/239/NSC_00238-R1_inositol monophosphatase - like protein